MSPDSLIRRVGGVTALAELLGVANHTTISKWRARGRIPAERVPEISRLTGIPRHELRPDLWEEPVAGSR